MYDECLVATGISLGATHGAPNDVGDLHAMVVDHIGKVIGWMAVRFQQNGVIVHPLDQIQFVGRAVLSGLAIDQIIEHRVSLHLQTNHMRLSVCCAFFGFLGGDVCAFSVVSRR